MMAGAMVAAGIVGGLASWMWHLGHFDLYLAAPPWVAMKE
jgi:hypothetical protein